MNKVTTRKPNGGGQLLDSHLVGAVMPNAAMLIAYDGLATSLMLADGRCYIYSPNSILTIDGGIVLPATGKGSGQWIGQINGYIDVKLWYQAKGDSLRVAANLVTDDSVAIQKAINYARSAGQTSENYSRTVILITPGNEFQINSCLDFTNANGIFLHGGGGRYQNAVLRGNTGGLMIDLSGSTMCGLSNLSLASYNGTSNPSTRGVLFALTKNAPNQATAGSQKGGLDATIHNVSIQLANLPSANNGIGTIPVINCRSEEFSATDIYTLGNAGFIFTNRLDLLSTTGYNYTIGSDFAPLQDDNSGSMGNINIKGQVRCWERLSPAFLMNGINGLDFHGYIGRPTVTSPQTGLNFESAFVFCQQTFGVNIRATIEGFSRVVDFRNNLENVNIVATVANQSAPNTEVIKVDPNNMVVRNLNVDIGFGNPPEMANRFLIYCSDPNNGNSPISTAIINSTITCSSWADNTLAIPGNLLKNTTNTTFYTGQPFEVQAGWVKQLFRNPVSAGTLGAASNAQIMRIRRADRNTRSTGNAGSYSIRVYGTVTCGSPDSGARAMITFESLISYVHVLNTTQATTNVNTTIKGTVTTNSGGINITSVTPSLDISDPINYAVKILPTVSGANTGEPIVVDAAIEVLSDFSVNRTIIFV